MTTPRNYQVEAVIIKKTKLGEADSILTLYTSERGKIQGFAKSLRKPKSKLAGHLELLTHSQVALARGRNLDTITGSQTITSFLPLKSDLDLSAYALYVTELVHQFTADHIENPPLFQLLVATLGELCGEGDREIVLRYYELHLLNLVGYRPQLERCATCHQALEPVTNYFSPVTGGGVCPDCQPTASLSYPLSVNALKVLRWLQAGDLGRARQLRVYTALARELEMIMRGYLRHLLERDVKATAWLDSLRGR